MLNALPATLIGVMVLAQIPNGQDMIGVLLVMSGGCDPEADGGGSTCLEGGIHGFMRVLLPIDSTKCDERRRAIGGAKGRSRAFQRTVTVARHGR